MFFQILQNIAINCILQHFTGKGMRLAAVIRQGASSRAVVLRKIVHVGNH
ncbi:hypothetical protein ENTCAN_06040 [Enterobacter cancerogenus ATCC 35316]|nr:hypothetical protein ENTCAN_06040 [Enterobacter cancerogenus ATCC 35316]